MPRKKVSELFSLPLFLKFGQLLRPFLQLENQPVKLLSCFLILLLVHNLNQLLDSGLEFQDLSLQQVNLHIGLIGQSLIRSEIGNKDTWILWLPFSLIRSALISDCVCSSRMCWIYVMSPNMSGWLCCACWWISVYWLIAIFPALISSCSQSNSSVISYWECHKCSTKMPSRCQSFIVYWLSQSLKLWQKLHSFNWEWIALGILLTFYEISPIIYFSFQNLVL